MQFQYGGVSYPLTADTTKTLLQDADPGLFVLLDYVAFAITTYVGDRLLAEAAATDCRAAITAAVQTRLPYEPGPFLRAAQDIFPALFMYRRRATNDYVTLTRAHWTTTVDVAYVLPALSPAQAERILPIRYAVMGCLADRLERGQDDGYTPPGGAIGDRIGPIIGYERLDLTECALGGFEGVGDLYLPSLTFTLLLKERHHGDPGIPLTGIDAKVTVRAPDGTTTDPLVDSSTDFTPP